MEAVPSIEELEQETTDEDKDVLLTNVEDKMFKGFKTELQKQRAVN